MIIKWTGKGIKVIPCLGMDGQIVSKVILQPGNNEVSKDQWLAARQHCLEEIARKDILEDVAADIKSETIEKEVEDPKTKEKKKVKEKKVTITPKEFKKMDIAKAIEIVKETFNLKTLKEWEKKEGRDSVRAEIKNQIDAVENYHEDKKKALNKENK